MRLFVVSSLFVVGLLSACGRTQPDLLAAAQAALQARDPATARVQLKQCLQEQPASAEGRYLLGTVLLEQGEWAAAAVELDSVLSEAAEATVLLEEAEARRAPLLCGMPAWPHSRSPPPPACRTGSGCWWHRQQCSPTSSA